MDNEDFTSLQHRYLDERFRHLEDKIDSSIAHVKEMMQESKAAAQIAIERADIVDATTQKMSNEVRGQLKDQAELFIPKVEVYGRFEGVKVEMSNMRQDIVKLREAQSAQGGTASQAREGKMDARAVIVIGLTVAGLLIAAATFFGLRLK